LKNTCDAFEEVFLIIMNTRQCNMTDKKTLRSIVTDNWDAIAKNLHKDIENKPENMLLMLSYLRPLLNSAAVVFPRPSIGIYISVDDSYKKDLLTLEKMGFTDCTTYDSSTVSLTSKGVNLMNCYHKSKNPDFLTERELISKIISLSDHLYE
jgi:hypothetical protein